MNAQQLVIQLENVLGQLRDVEQHFSEADCPLAHSEEGHCQLSRMVFGSGCYAWTCGLCGKPESD